MKCIHDNRFWFTFCFLARPRYQISPADETVLPVIDRFVKVICDKTISLIDKP